MCPEIQNRIVMSIFLIFQPQKLRNTYSAMHFRKKTNYEIMIIPNFTNIVMDTKIIISDSTRIFVLAFFHISCNNVPLLSTFLAISESSVGPEPSDFLFIFTPFLSNCFSIIFAFMAYESAISFCKIQMTKK